MNPTVIPLSKPKMLLLLLFAALFVVAGAWMFNMDAADIENGRRMRSPLFVHGVGLLGILFGALGCVGILRKLVDPSPGLVIDDRGLTDNSSLFSAGFIPWSEIEGFAVHHIQRQRQLVVLLRDPDRYIEGLGPVRRWMARANRNMVPSPVVIAGNTLAMKFDEVHGLLAQRFEAQHPRP